MSIFAICTLEGLSLLALSTFADSGGEETASSSSSFIVLVAELFSGLAFGPVSDQSPLSRNLCLRRNGKIVLVKLHKSVLTFNEICAKVLANWFINLIFYIQIKFVFGCYNLYVIPSQEADFYPLLLVCHLFVVFVFLRIILLCEFRHFPRKNNA